MNQRCPCQDLERLRDRNNLQEWQHLKASLVTPPPSPSSSFDAQLALPLPLGRGSACCRHGRGREPGSALVLRGAWRAEGPPWAPERRWIRGPERTVLAFCKNEVLPQRRGVTRLSRNWSATWGGYFSLRPKAPGERKRRICSLERSVGTCPSTTCGRGGGLGTFGSVKAASRSALASGSGMLLMGPQRGSQVLMLPSSEPSGPQNVEGGGGSCCGGREQGFHRGRLCSPGLGFSTDFLSEGLSLSPAGRGVRRLGRAPAWWAGGPGRSFTGSCARTLGAPVRRPQGSGTGGSSVSDENAPVNELAAGCPAGRAGRLRGQVPVRAQSYT